MAKADQLKPAISNDVTKKKTVRRKKSISSINKTGTTTPVTMGDVMGMGCPVSFVPKNSSQKYCTHTCYLKHRAKKNEKISASPNGKRAFSSPSSSNSPEIELGSKKAKMEYGEVVSDPEQSSSTA